MVLQAQPIFDGVAPNLDISNIYRKTYHINCVQLDLHKHYYQLLFL